MMKQLLTEGKADAVANRIRDTDDGGFGIYNYLLNGVETCVAWAADSVETVIAAASAEGVDTTGYCTGRCGSRVVAYFPHLEVSA